MSVGKTTETVYISEAEARVLRLVAFGHTNQQIAYVLGVSDQTVKNQVMSLMLKLDVESRINLTVAALVAEVVHIDELLDEIPRARDVQIRSLKGERRPDIERERMRRHLESLLRDLDERDRATG